MEYVNYMNDGLHRNIDSVDVFRAFLALMVMAIHSHLLPILLFPWVRLAVPCFFLISSYFYFLKNEHEKLKKFSIRLLRLYVAWFIVLMPITFYMKRETWFGGGCAYFLLQFTKSLLFGSTFAASWFFPALFFGVVIVHYAQKKFPLNYIVAFSAVPFAFACFSSCWTVVPKNQLFFLGWLSVLEECVSSIMVPQFSVFASILWISVGAVLAERHLVCSRKCLIHLILLGAVLLFCEWHFVYAMTGNFDEDCLFSLPLVVVPLFLLIKDSCVQNKYAKELRLFSVIAYPCHYSVIYCINCFMRLFKVSDEYGAIRFCLVLVIVITITCLIRKAETKGLSIVRWLH